MKRIGLVLLSGLLCLCLSSCSLSFDSILENIKAYINGDEVETIPEDFVESRKNDDYEYDVYDTYIEITSYIGALTYVTVPSEIDGLPVTKIGSLAFYYGTSPVTVILPETITELDENAFYYCKQLTAVRLPNSITKIGEKCFSWCSSLTIVNLPDSITEIPNFCFNECTSLQTVNTNENIETVGNRAFSGCTSLMNLKLGTAVEEIGMYAFINCTSLQELELPFNCSILTDAFGGCQDTLTVITGAGGLCEATCKEMGIATRQYSDDTTDATGENDAIDVIG